MSTQILIKRSTTTGAVPTTSDIAVGELAINTVDKRIFTNNSGTIVELGTTPTTQAVTGNASVGGTFDVVGAVTVGNFTADGTVDLTSATVTIPAPTADTHPATKKYVDDEVNAILAGAPAALDTLNEIAAAINDDANVYTTLTNSIATKLSLSGGTMTGSIDMGANSVTTSADPATDNTLTRKSYVDGLYQSTVDAEVSAANALASEQAAATSATNAATSASASATSASAASTSATNAASSATAAASSATSSANSATASATSATQSAASATQAQALVDSIESFYLGAEASAPTVDDNGDPLQAGDWYFNTTDSQTYIYNGSSWDAVSPDVVGDTTPQLGGDLDTNGNDVLFGDNDKAIFGAGSDLQIYHDGSYSFISEQGTGDLLVRADKLKLQSSTGENFLYASPNSFVRLYFDNAEKLATTSTGIDVTGTATMDGLTVSTGDVIDLSGGSSGEYIDSSAGIMRLNSRGSVLLYLDTNNNDPSSNAEFTMYAGGTTGGTTDKKMTVTRGGDISFYEDTGTTAKFFWDASAERLGVGTSSPASQLEMSKAGGTSLRIKDATSGYTTVIEQNSNTDTQIRANNPIALYTAGNERMRIDSSGNVGIGTSSPTAKLDVGDTNDPEITMDASASGHLRVNGGTYSFAIANNSTGTYLYNNGSNRAMVFGTNETEHMRIDSSGNLLVGTATVPYTAGNSGAMIYNAADWYGRINLGKSLSGSVWGLRCYHNGAGVGGIMYGDTSTSFNTSSDYRLKEDWQPVTNASSRVAQLKPVNFAWKASGERVDGFLAHELAEVIPEAVTGTKDSMRTEEYEVSPAVLDDEGNVVTEAVIGTREVPDYQGIDQSKLVPLLTAALQEALARIETLEADVSALKGV